MRFTRRMIHDAIAVHDGLNTMMKKRNLRWYGYISRSSGISSQSLNLDGRRGTIDDFATIPFHLSLSSAALRESPNSIPWCYLHISSSVFLSFLILSLSPAELSSPYQRILRCGHTICFHFFTMVRSSCTPTAFWILLQTSSFVTWPL